MARLINDQGTWYLQINKDQPKELFALLSNLDGFYLENHKEEANIFIFRISDSCQGDIYNISESDYRNILSKISEIPDPDLIIPRETITQEPTLSDEEYQKLVIDLRMEGKSGFEIMHMPKVYRYLLGQYPKVTDLNFLAEVALDSNPSNPDHYKWHEENKLIAKDILRGKIKKTKE